MVDDYIHTLGGMWVGYEVHTGHILTFTKISKIILTLRYARS